MTAKPMFYAGGVRSGVPGAHRTVRYQSIVGRIAAAEFLGAACAAYATGIAYSWGISNDWLPFHTNVLGPVSLATFILLISLASRQYSIDNAGSRPRFLWLGVRAVGLAFCFFLSTLFLSMRADAYSRVTICFQLVAVTVAVLCVRAIGQAWLHAAIMRGGVEARRVILLGDHTTFQPVTARLKRTGMVVVGSFALPGGDLADAGVTVGELIEHCRLLDADDVVFCASGRQIAVAPQLATELAAKLPVSFHVIRDYKIDALTSARYSELGDLTTLQILQPPLSAVDLLVKRAFDIVTASVGLALVSPFLLIAAIAIKLETPGPVLFRQERHGYNWKVFKIFKLRTMHVASEAEQSFTTVKSDPRLTRVGRLLRSTNIDELPQLLNVLKGEMSIVGPRPHVVAEDRLFEGRVPLYSRRLLVKPGITGWAQVNGLRGPADEPQVMQRRIDLDLFYIENWSLLLDFRIVVLTLFSRASYTNAF